MGGRAEARCQRPRLQGSARFAGKTGPALPGPVLFFLKLETEPRERPIDAGEIARAEQPDMHEERIEIVEVSPELVKGRLERHQAFIDGKERRPERAEEGREGELDLGVRARDRGVDGSGEASPRGAPPPGGLHAP